MIDTKKIIDVFKKKNLDVNTIIDLDGGMLFVSVDGDQYNNSYILNANDPSTTLHVSGSRIMMIVAKRADQHTIYSKGGLR